MKKNHLYFFNPGHEGAILNASPYYMAPSNVVRMQQELAYLPAWYANNNDFVLLQEMLPVDFIENFSDNLLLPKGITSDDLISINDSLSVHLWGISPQAIHYFQNLNNKYNLDLQLPVWKGSLKEFSNRLSAKNCLIQLLEAIPSISNDIVPSFYSDLETIEKKVLEIDYQILAKAPYSSSGRGLLWLPKDGLTRTERQILHGILKKQGQISLEKALDKKLDFAMEFYLNESNDIDFLGYSLFETTPKGVYLGNHINSQNEIINIISQYLDKNLLVVVEKSLKEILPEMFSDNYSGCIGVDMLVYEENGEYRLHPCVEINVRDNMGLLAIKLYEKHIHPNSKGYFRIDFNSKQSEIYNKHILMQETYPLEFLDNKIYSGYFPLCPVNEDSRYHAYVVLNQASLL